MNITDIIIITTTIIGSSTIIFRALLKIADLTKTDKDNKIINNILHILEILSLNISKINNNIVIKKK